MEYDNTNSGALFKNDKATTDKHPTHTGSINVDGVEYWLSAWVKVGKRGKFFSLAVKPKETPQERKAPARPSPRQSSGLDEDSDVPF